MTLARSVKRLVAIAAGTGLALTVVFVVSGPDLRRRAYRAWIDRFGPEPIGQGMLQTADPELGWTNLAGTRARQANVDYDVWYHIDAGEGRRIPGHHPDSPIVEILGDSFAFGQGVEDRKTFGAVLQRSRWPDVHVRIRASLGWGTAQSYQALRRDLERGDPISLAIYAWLPFHNSRNHLSASWLTMVGQTPHRLPHFVVRDGRPVFERLVGPADAKPDGTPEMVAAQWQITEALLREMDRLCREHGARFIVALIPFEQSGTNPDVTRLQRTLEAAQIEYLVAHGDARFEEGGLFFPYDGHPNARWHALLADFLAEHVSTR